MKQYNGEKAIISLTSWKGRINNVSKSIYSLLKECPDFHIVLVLSEEEFPKKEAQLPKNLMLLIDNNMIELLWVYKNYKSFKKILFTMEKYPNVPIISADDGNYYIMNFAEALYTSWNKDKKSIFISEKWGKSKFCWGVGGRGIIFPPGCFNLFDPKKILSEKIINTNHDDALYGVLAKLSNVHIKICNELVNKKIYIENYQDFLCSLGRAKAYNDNDVNKICIEVMNLCK